MLGEGWNPARASYNLGIHSIWADVVSFWSTHLDSMILGGAT